MDQRILIVEDDAALAVRIAELLRDQGFDAATEGRGDRAVARILRDAPSLVVLDVMLPGKDGLTVCREVRRSYLGPILMLTARGDDADEVLGLEVGADDYLAKPVRPPVLLARIRALLRRPGAAQARKAERISAGDVTIDASAREAHVRGVRVDLTSGELDLLYFFASRADEVLSRAVIYQELRGATYDDSDRSIDLMVSRLRFKLSTALDHRDVIKTVRGVGYVFSTKV
jgi:two-component system, OmpR family, response regulator RstA